MPSYIEKRANTWYATLKVPKELQAKVGKAKFLKSLDTTDKRRAVIAAMPHISRWKAEIRKAAGEADAVIEDALIWREALAQARRNGDEMLLDVVPELIEKEHDKLRKKKGERAATTFTRIALGHAIPSDHHYEGWKGSIAHLAQKTQDQAIKDVERLTKRFVMLEDITPAAAREWVEALQQGGASSSSVGRMMSFWRSYWRYLASGAVAAVPPNSFPFSAETIRKEKKRSKGDTWLPFAPEDVPGLWGAAADADDAELADLIRLGAFSGARIEELCALKVDRVSEESFKIDDAKTAAGIREVPIHPTIKALVSRLKRESEDGYLLSGLTFNKYGDRSNAIGKRFGRLKTALGFGKNHVFHSLRKTVVTLLEDAGVSENLAADIVGHEKPRITYGLYSGGASLRTKADAIARVKYPQLLAAVA